MNEQPPSAHRSKRWKWILGIAAVALASSIAAAIAILSSLDFNSLKPLIIQIVKQETGRDIEIRGLIDLKLSLRPSLVMGDVLFQNAQGGTAPEMVKIRRLEAELLLLPLLSKEIQVNRLVLLEPDILIERDKAGKWNFEFERPREPGRGKAPFQRFTLPRLGFHKVRVEKGTVYYRDDEKGVFCCVAIERLSAGSEGIESPITLTLKGSYNEKPFELAGTLGSLLLLKEAGKPYPVNLTAKAADSRFIVEGTIQNILRLKGLALKVGAEVVSSSQAASFFDKSLPVELGPLQASAAIAGDADKGYQISDLKIASKAGDAEGTLGFSLEGARPKISGSMTSRRIDLSSLLDRGRTTQPRAEAGARKSRIFPNEPLSLDMLTQVDLQIKLNAEQVQLPQILLTSLSMEASAKDGRLALSPIKLKASGGDTEGHVELQHQGRLAMAKAIFKVSGMDLHLLATDLKAEGKVDADLDLFGRGASIAGFMAGLNGRAVLVMGHGRVDNKTIQLLGGELGSGVFQLLNPSSKTANHTDINCAVSGFDIKDGMAKVTGLVVDTPDMTIIGEGQVNLRDETLDLSLKPYGKGGAAGVSLSLGELAKSFKLGGTLAHPSLKIDAAQTMITAGKAAGGVLLFGPAGILAALAGESSGGGNPCLTALEAAKKGVKASGSEKGKGQKATEEKGVSGTLKAVGESVKKFFSGQGTRPPSDRRSSPLGGEGP